MGSISLALIWEELSLGRCRVVDSFFTEGRSYLVTRTVVGPGKPLDDGRRQVLESILAGTGQKTIAIERDVAASTIAAHARSALEQLGFNNRPSQVPPLLMLAGKAAREPESKFAVRLCHIEGESETLRVISAARPDVSVERVSPAELSVLRRAVEGLPYSEIARLRGTSMRTIANQLTAVFRRLRVSGRRELILRLFELTGEWAARI
jgi:DNA-binding NarL/FixJ family response regulator